MGVYTPIGQGSGVWHGHTDEMERNGRHQGEADSRSSNSPCLAWPAPKVLMQSGIGDQTTLQRLGIPVLQHLPGVGENFEDHLAFDCVWEYQEALSPRNNMSEAIFFWGSKSGLHSPDLFASQAEVDIRECSKISSARCRVDTARGRRPPKKPRASSLTGPNPLDPIETSTPLPSCAIYKSSGANLRGYTSRVDRAKILQNPCRGPHSAPCQSNDRRPEKRFRRSLKKGRDAWRCRTKPCSGSYDYVAPSEGGPS
jgi:GMC oxidoreductase